MALDGPRSKRDLAAEASFPHEGVPWFEALPAERRRAMRRAHVDELRRDDQLARNHRRRRFRDVLQMTALFLVADQLFAPHASLGSGLASVAVGALLGLLGSLVHADRILTGFVGGAAFFLVQLVSRGGLTGMHMFLFFPVGALCMYLGYRREERAYGT